jgi:hypothetical protein
MRRVPEISQQEGEMLLRLNAVSGMRISNTKSPENRHRVLGRASSKAQPKINPLTNADAARVVVRPAVSATPVSSVIRNKEPVKIA